MGVFDSWNTIREAERIERERLAYLNRPLPGNPKELTKSVKVRVLQRFLVMGNDGERLAKIGEVLELFPVDAQRLAVRGHCLLC